MATGKSPDGLNRVWNFESIRRVIITTQKIGPGDPSWNSFTCIPNPSAFDYADASQKHGVTFTALAPLAPPSAAVTVLNDGKGQINNNSTAGSLFFADKSKGNRILIGLNGLQPVYQVNTYSWHKFGRKNQRHELFYNTSISPTDPKAEPLGNDWVSLGSVDTSYTRKSDGQVGVSYTGSDGNVIAKARHLLLKVNFAPCFYGEIDVVTGVKTSSKQELSPKAEFQSKKMCAILNGEGQDPIQGNFELVKGVRGNALKFDGFTTRVVRKADQAVLPGKSFTIEAWIAPQEYGINHTAIINQEKDGKTGYFFGIDLRGHLVLQANIDGSWETCVSEEILPILRWSHVAGTIDPEKGMAVYIDGKPAGRNPVKGTFIPAKETDIWIGMSQTKQVPAGKTRRGEPGWLVFDGLIDELKIHYQALSAKQVRTAFASIKPADVQPLQYRKMPSGPKDGKRFGAFYTRLHYTPESEKQWRVGGFADVVVTFEDNRANFVFWRGTSYIPHWVTRNGIWYNNQFVERSANSDGCTGCIEPMSDKMCRFSHVRIIQSNPARTIIHWRYAPVGLNLKHPFIDPYTGQGDWVDEYYIIYSDMVGVRSMTLYSTAISEKADWQEAIIVHQPGSLPEDNIMATAISIGNLAGEAADFTWPGVAKKGGDLEGVPEKSCIQIINLKSGVKPFMIVPPSQELKIQKFRGHEPHSIFHQWNHWPVSQGRSSTTPASDASKPSHTSLTVWRDWDFHRSTENSRTRLMLHGMTDKGIKNLVGLAKSWISPPEVKILSGNYRNESFNKEQKAYVLEIPDQHQAGPLRFKLEAGPDSPLVHPAIVIKNWPADSAVRVKVNGKKPRAEDIRLGLEKELKSNNLVAWLRLKTTKPIEIEIKPVKGGAKGLLSVE
jgi:hypothetical protein